MALAGCDGTIGVSRDAPERVLVADQTVIVAGPPGYCVDSALSRASDANAFVLLGSCASIAGTVNEPAPSIPAVLTVSVSSQIGAGPDPEAVQDYLRTSAGRAALSRSGEASSVDIIEMRRSDDAVFIHARDRSRGDIAGVSDTYWRALFVLNGRLITASVVGFESKPITAEAGFVTLRDLTARLRRENDRLTVSTRGTLPG